MPVDTHVLAHDIRYFVIAYALAIGAAFLPLDPVWPKWIVAVVLLGIYALVRQGPLRGRPRRRRRRTSRRCASTGSTAARTAPTRRVPRLRIVNVQVARRARPDRRSAPSSSSTPSSTSPRRSASTASCSRWSSRRSRRSCPRSSTGHLGPRRARTRSRWATSPGRWSSSRTIPTVVALVFASSTLVDRRSRQLHRLRVGRHRVPRRRARSSSRWRAPGTLRGRNLLVGGVFYARLPGARRSPRLAGG